jgi:hypothetical protein
MKSRKNVAAFFTPVPLGLCVLGQLLKPVLAEYGDTMTLAVVRHRLLNRC